ncbi:hypothetical protein BD410DRAFT_4113 [Rickenella mellea]|uniref:Uncharacterized protein n=1 Tax=Rickenella mellea TaxID=50990 RepID=A0A4R5XEE6_9AGAM|nr:hypothetical protein BD410DRAFT_4113 [Rickenella mellea]
MAPVRRDECLGLSQRRRLSCWTNPPEMDGNQYTMPEKPPRRIPAADVDFLISALHRIKLNGRLHGHLEDMENWFDNANDWIDPDMLPFPDGSCKFCEPDISLPAGCHRYPKDANSLRDALRQLKAVDVVMKLIRKSLSQRVMCLGKRCAELELQNGLRGTPDEVLSHIFQLAHLSSGRQGHRVTTTLASVCTRFRTICLQSPGMWSSLSSHQAPATIRLNLARSKESQLSIFLAQRLRVFPDRNMVEFLHIVTPHSRRWAYLEISTRDHTHFAKTFSMYTALDLPKLSHIRCIDPNAGHQMTHGPFIHFCSMWNIPSLKRFDANNVVPDQNSVGAHIRECYLKWNAWESGAKKRTTVNTVELPIEYLSGCLRTLASLRHLNLDFEDARINSGLFLDVPPRTNHWLT